MSSDRIRPPGDLALIESLINTLDVERGADGLAAPEGRAAFARATGVAELSEDEVPAAVRLRELLRAACAAHAGTPMAEAETSALNALLAGAPLRVRVGADGGAELVPSGDSLLARVAAALAAARADGTWERLKVCPADDCRWAFYDHSPAGRRRWCSMQVCGARAKMRAYRARRG
ncbi:CGNR zinc finger domain-containing protein [Streptomyces sp. DSM 44917]|uniref:CGNR zinc finger domain-containing protein n=1 Tax=Streptomyces boetiae TaxID=3075541 RepID=A0ABU2LCX3_9ACTN|nr:CGNR zinc finger domain-containing protein [Streptomyces sp. DSM 44917]MDT0309372.1 CGNR zinc finger domain-containing protein [Streptomyces sp. DSM 44917]